MRHIIILLSILAIHTHSIAKQIKPPATPSYGSQAGLHKTLDPLHLKSGVAFVFDASTNTIVFSKNEFAVLPIASITKLMTSVVLSESNLPMDEQITITNDDIKNTRSSKLKIGTTMSRSDMIHLALMSSENRAAYALGRTYPGGVANFVAQMNRKAAQLGMTNTNYNEPTGLSPENKSTAHDLAKLVSFSSTIPLIREFSTSKSMTVMNGKRLSQFNNTNRLTSNPKWVIDVQKTGFIDAAGRCLVMQAKIAEKTFIMIFLDSAGKNSRLGDAERVRSWIEKNTT
jgi:serine-type D-Ala-D-Ala endopeptidase (penicillin-binding protein 7)